MGVRLQAGDEVLVIAGKEKGKKGKIARIDREADKVFVEGLNLVKRHLRPTPKNPQGGILEKEAPIHASNVMLVDDQGKPTRVRFRRDDKGNSVRVAVTTGKDVASQKRDRNK